MISSKWSTLAGRGSSRGAPSLARHVIGSLTGYLDSGEDRRDLQDGAAELGQGGLDGGVVRADVAGLGDLAVAVVGVAGLAEFQSEAVQFRPVHDVGNGLRRGPKGNGEKPGGERVQGAAMARLLGVEQTLDAIDHVSAGHPGRLVDDQPPVERAALGLAARHIFGGALPSRRRRGRD